MMRWSFEVNVRKGAKIAKDDTFRSEFFASFKDCFQAYVRFIPAKHWGDLQHVVSEAVFFESERGLKKNSAEGGFICYKDAVEDIGVTETEFDTIISEIAESAFEKYIMKS